MDEQLGRSDSDPSVLATARARAFRLVVTRSSLEEQLALVNSRIDDEIRGLDQRTAMSIHDEVERLEDLIRELFLRIDTFMAEVGRIDEMAGALEGRLAEVVELRGQERSAERLDARRFAELEERLRSLEGRSSPDQ